MYQSIPPYSAGYVRAFYPIQLDISEYSTLFSWIYQSIPPFSAGYIRAFHPFQLDMSEHSTLFCWIDQSIPPYSAGCQSIPLHAARHQSIPLHASGCQNILSYRVGNVRLIFSLVMSMFLYACETWTITADNERRIQALEIRCFSKLLGISYRDHITKEEVKLRIRNAIGLYEGLLTSVERCKMKWYRHITRSSGLAKTVLQGTVQGGRWRGWQRKRWEDNIKKWTGLEWNSILRKAENREEWRKLAVKSPVVPQRSARLWDRWRWM